MSSSFKLTEKQKEQTSLCASSATKILAYGGGRCVSGDTIPDGHNKTIKELCEENKSVAIKTTRGKQVVPAPIKKGEDFLLKFELENGASIKVTDDHLFWDGTSWKLAKEFSCGDSLAYTCSNIPARSTSDTFLSTLPLSVQRYSQKLLNYLGRCLVCCRQYGLQLPLYLISFPIYYASLFCERVRSRFCRGLRSLFLLSLGLNNRDLILSLCESKDIRTYHRCFLHSKMDGYSLKERVVLFSGPFALRTSEWFLDLRQKYLPTLGQSFLGRLALKAIDTFLDQFCQFFDLFDKPYVNPFGVKMVKVLNITKTAKESYYCFYVAGSHEYFANGVLNHNSGKTFNFARNVLIRALKAPGSYHVIARKHFSHVKQAILIQTWPALIEKSFKGLEYRLDKMDWYIELQNKSQIWFAGVDDKERMEKILGKEFVTIYLNEISELSYDQYEMLMTRLAQKVYQEIEGERRELPLKVYLDCNPPPKSHWSYTLFFKLQDPNTKSPLVDKDDYQKIQMNPVHNKENISSKYLEMMENSSARMKKRFFDGQYGDDNPNALFSDINFQTNRVMGGELPDMLRVIVGVDPSGSGDEDNAKNDEIGIICGGLGVDGRAYLLEDCTIKAGPATWGKVSTDLWARRKGDLIVAEKNFGGEMVRFVIQTARNDVPTKIVNASRGKVVRAEPFSALYEQGKIRHVGYFHELEDELLGFSTYGYNGKKSPNRADAWVWVLTELLSGLVAEEEEVKKIEYVDSFSW